MDYRDILELLEEEEQLRNKVYKAEADVRYGNDGRDKTSSIINEFFYETKEESYFDENESVSITEVDNTAVYDACGFWIDGDGIGGRYNKALGAGLEIPELNELAVEEHEAGKSIAMPIEISVNIDIEGGKEELNIEKVIGAVADRLREELSAAAEGLYL